MYVHIRRHDTMAPIMLRVGSDEIASLRQTQLRFKQALQLELQHRKY